MQSIDSIETFAYVTSRDLVSEKKENKCNDIKKQCKKWYKSALMLKKRKHKKHNLNWPQIPDHPYRILIVSGSESNAPFNLISHQPDIDKIYLYTKDPYQTNY